MDEEYLAENRAGECANVTIVFAILEVFFISLFFFARIKNKTANDWDFYLMVPAFLCCYSIIPVNILLILYGGVGRHLASLTLAEINYFMKLFVTMQFTYVPAVTLPKLAILALYQRIFTTKFYRWMSYLVGQFMILVWLISLVLAFTECQPFEYSWNKSISGRCIDIMILFRYVSGLNLASDVAILILPLPVIWGLHTSRAQKVGLTLAFLTGSVGMVTCILRFVVFYKTDILSDPTWFSIEMTIWTTTETGIYLIAACLPSLRSLVLLISKHKYFGKVWTSLSSHYPRKLLSRPQNSAGQTTEMSRRQEYDHRQPSSEITTMTTITTTKPPPQCGKWARFETRSLSSSDEAALKHHLTSYGRDRAPRNLTTVDINNNGGLDLDLDLEKCNGNGSGNGNGNEQGIRVQRSYHVSVSVDTSMCIYVQ